MKSYSLVKVAGLSLTAKPSAIFGTVVLWGLLSGAAVGLLNLPIQHAIIGGLIAAILHWISTIVHHLGHAWAAYQTGHPMVGIQLGTWLIFSTSVYPKNEKTLPAAIHIRRALGGPAGSLLLSIVTGLIALTLRPLGGWVWWLGLFVFLDNLLVLTFGAFLPLGFTDGSTLLKWWGRH